MSIQISSANGPIVKEFAANTNFYKDVGELDEVTFEQQITLAGPNDNIHFLIDFALIKVAEPIVKEILKEILKLEVEDVYKNKAKYFKLLSTYGIRVIDFLSNHFLGSFPYAITIVLGTSTKKIDSKKRNIGIKINAVGKDKLTIYALIMSELMPEIKEYAENVSAINENLNKRTFWITNEDFSVAILFDGFVPYIKYREISSDFMERKEVKVRFLGDGVIDVVTSDIT